MTPSVVVIIAALALLPVMAEAGTICPPPFHGIEAIEADLRDHWHEAPIWGGISKEGVLTRLWQNGDTLTWTIVGELPTHCGIVQSSGTMSLGITSPARGDRINMER